MTAPAAPTRAPAARTPFTRTPPRLRAALRGAPVLPIAILAVLVVVGALAPLLVPHDPNTVRLMQAHLPPVFLGGSWDHVLGTDDLGRDVLSRLVSGARISLLVGFAVVFGAGTIGTVLALLAGYFGGIVDSVISRLVEVFIAVPFLLVAIAVVGAAGASTQNLILTLIFMTWAGYARVLRSEVLRLRELDFVKLAKVAGCSHARILFRHILPNIVNPLMILATLQLGATMVVEASLSFLGLGVPPPQATWGGMLAAGKNFIGFQDSLVFVPGATIFVVVMAINLVGDWLRVRLDPRFRQL